MTRILFVAALFAACTASRAEETTVYKIGIPKSMFRDVPPALVAFAGQPFSDLVKDQAGLKSKIEQDPDAMHVAKQIDDGTLQLGVFQGHEFAWAQEKYPTLLPIVSLVYRPKEFRGIILIRQEAKAKDLSDLAGAKLALATTLKDHARLFLQKRQLDELVDGKKFGSTAEASSVHEAIQQVKDRIADVTVADLADWNYFQKLYPGPSKTLKVLAKSDVFPPTVLAYKKGTLTEPILKKIRDGFLTAHESAKAARMMGLIRIERFSEVPESYDSSLKACRKAYPQTLAGK